MFMQGLHLKQCGMVQSEMVDPCLYYKIMERLVVEGTASRKEVSGFLIVITWVDDCRYLGTQDLISEYEKTVGAYCNCTFEGVSSEFVSVQMNHNLQLKTMELT
jgi:hypothetical protein